MSFKPEVDLGDMVTTFLDLRHPSASNRQDLDVYAGTIRIGRIQRVSFVDVKKGEPKFVYRFNSLGSPLTNWEFDSMSDVYEAVLQLLESEVWDENDDA